MDSWEPVGSIRQNSDSGSGDEDGTEFIQCVDGRDIEINEFWTFRKDGVTHELHPTAEVDTSAGFVGEFTTNYLTKSWIRVSMFGVNSINISVQWLGVPKFLRTDGPPWTDYGIFVLTGIESIGDIVPLVVLVPRGFMSKVGGLIESFWRPES